MDFFGGFGAFFGGRGFDLDAADYLGCEIEGECSKCSKDKAHDDVNDGDGEKEDDAGSRFIREEGCYYGNRNDN